MLITDTNADHSPQNSLPLQSVKLTFTDEAVKQITQFSEQFQRSNAFAWLSKVSHSGVLWLVLWFLLNVALTLMNKALFQFSGFVFPLAVSTVHMLFTALLSSATCRYMAIPVKPLTEPIDRIIMFAFSLLFCFNIVSGNLGLRYVPVSLVQCVRSVIPGITMLLSIFVLHKQFSRAHYAAVCLVVIGVITATLGSVEWHTWGLIFTVLVCFLSSLKSVVTNKFLVGSMKFHPFDLLSRMSRHSFVYMVLLCIFTGEASRLSTWWCENGSGLFLLYLSFNGTIAFFLNVCNFFFTKYTSALTVTVAGNVKHVCTIALGILIFSTPISTFNALGIFITVCGAAFYSSIDYRFKHVKLNSGVPV